jgi:serine protease SohB
VNRLGDETKRHRETLEEASLSPVARKAAEKAKKAAHKRDRKSEKKALKRKVEPKRGRVFVLDFDGDLRATAVSSLRREITAVLSLAEKEDEVVVRLESGGGMVHAYGLGASQLDRIRQKGIKLTVIVDKVAASGGYMMACVATQLLAAPFAVLGSIGVVAQLPNFHRLLKKHDVDFELFTAGQYKRTVTVFGENTQEGREKFKKDIEETHGLFKEFVSQHRPSVSIEEVSTGEIWYGKQALDKGLIDGLMTSDDYLSRAAEEHEVLALRFKHRESLKEKLESSLESTVDRLLLRWWDRGVRAPRL